MALIHHQFESIHPFYDGNGRTDRLLNVLHLVNEGLLDIPVLYLSRYILRNKPDYYRLLQAVRTDDRWEDWVAYTNTIRSIATFRAPDGFACKARWRRHSCSTSSHLNAAGGFVRSPRRACLSARVDGVVVARCRLSYRLRADALPHAPRDKLNEAILLIVLVAPKPNRHGQERETDPKNTVRQV